jgi:hypothetical protein
LEWFARKVAVIRFLAFEKPQYVVVEGDVGQRTGFIRNGKLVLINS